MDLLALVTDHLQGIVQSLFANEMATLPQVTLTINMDKDASFGDLCSTIALQLSKPLRNNPRALAQKICEAATALPHTNSIVQEITRSCTIAGPGFLNFTIPLAGWHTILESLLSSQDVFFKPKIKSQRYLVEFVSANPTGPLHLAHGRNAIIGDVLCSVLSFLGHDVTREFYLNDAGNQIGKLGLSLRARYLNILGLEEPFPEGGYAGNYLRELAQHLFETEQDTKKEADVSFFAQYARDHMLSLVQDNLAQYGVKFDHFTSEKSLYVSGAVDQALELLKEKGFVYELDDALWLKSTAFGDDKDRVLRKADGEMTYITPDIAYYKSLFERDYDHLINILGQDHHGYVTRRNAALQALGFNTAKLHCILYQLVLMKQNDVYVRMSKRAGNFEQLSDVIKIVGKDVARYFFLNRKADGHLELDLEQALKHNDENPVYYIHYAFVRTGSLIAKAHETFPELVKTTPFERVQVSAASIPLIKKIISLRELLLTIGSSYQTHLLSYYTHELAAEFHSFYTHNKIIVPDNQAQTQNNLAIVLAVRVTLKLCFDLLGLSKPERM